MNGEIVIENKSFKNENSSDSNGKKRIEEKTTPHCKQLDEKVFKSEITVDEFLQYVGQLGRFQILVVFTGMLMFFVPAYQAFITVFIAHSPPWMYIKTHSNNVTVNVSEADSYNSVDTVYYEGQPGFNDRCDLVRSQWHYTLPGSHSIVSEVGAHIL